MFKVGEKVVYPKHGAGKIVDIYQQTIGKEIEKYYKIGFLNSLVTVSIPVKKAEEFGLRYLMGKKALIVALKVLNTRVLINKETLVSLDAVSKQKLASGKLEDVIDLVNLLKSLAKQKEEENKNFSYSYSNRLELATDFIKSEISLVLGKSALKKYKLC